MDTSKIEFQDVTPAEDYQYTPGPYHTSKDHRGVFARFDRIAIVTGGGRWVAYASPASAPLLTAAPVLLAVCQHFAMACNCNQAQAPQELMEELEAAIASATP